MKLFKVSIKVGDMTIQSTVQPGMPASAKVSCQCETAKTLKPQHKVNLIAGLAGELPAAWIQVLKFNESLEPVVTHEGWINNETTAISSTTGKSTLEATIEEIVSPSTEMIKSQEKMLFGALACCTYHGTNCSVQCCGGCCSTSSCGGCCP